MRNSVVIQKPVVGHHGAIHTDGICGQLSAHLAIGAIYTTHILAIMNVVAPIRWLIDEVLP